MRSGPLPHSCDFLLSRQSSNNIGSLRLNISGSGVLGSSRSLFLWCDINLTVLVVITIPFLLKEIHQVQFRLVSGQDLSLGYSVVDSVDDALDDLSLLYEGGVVLLGDGLFHALVGSF